MQGTYMNDIVEPLLCAIIPGLIFLIRGVRTWKNKEIVLFGRERYGTWWSKPKLVKGTKTVFWVKFFISMGLFMILMGVLVIIAIYIR